MDTHKIISQIKKIKGIKEVKLLDEEQKEFIQEIELDEEKQNGIINQGIKDVMRRKIIFLATHNHFFRKANEKLVNEKTILSTSFPELKKHKIDAIIASPSWNTHEYLSAFVKLDKDDATLLIGI